MQRLRHSTVLLSLAAAAGLSACTPVSSSTGPVPKTPASSGIYFVAERGLNQVAAVKASDGSVVATLKTGNAPAQFAEPGSQSPNIWVANSGSGSISEIDPVALKILATVNVGGDPEFLAPGGNYLYVANVQSKSVSVMFTKSASVVATIALAGTPISIASAADAGNVFVGEEDGKIEVIDTATNTVVGHLQASGTLGGVAALYNGVVDNTDTMIVATNDGKIEALVGANGNYSAYSTFSVHAGTLQTRARGTDIFVFNETTNELSRLHSTPQSAD